MQLRGLRTLVTGADGFIGSHLVEHLLAEGCRVRAFVFYNSFNSTGWLEALSRDDLKGVEVVSGDVRDSHAVRDAVKGCDVVFHLAALIGIPFSYRAPEAYVDTNVRGTLNVLQACREHDVTRAVITSTSEVYGTARYVPIDERHPFQGQSPYAATKIGADRLAEAFHCSFGTPMTIARPFNTYGPRQSARAVIPTIITQLLHGTRDVMIGSLHPTRDFNFVDDTCRGLTALAQCDAAVGQEVNIGSGVEVSIGELFRMLTELIGVSAIARQDAARQRPPASEIDRLVCDHRLIKQLTDWEPKVPLRMGLERTIAWFRTREHLAAYKPFAYNV